MTKNATVSNDVMSSLSDICISFCVTEKFNFYVIEEYSYMLCCFTETKADTNYTCILLFFSFDPRC